MTDARWVLPLLLVGFLGSASAGGPEAVEALLGFDPVLLTEGKEVLGNEGISLTREGFRYHFANAKNKSTFMGDPERYGIQMGGLCARLGESVPGAPDMYTVHAGRIYLVASEECRELFEATPSKYLEPEPPLFPSTADTVKKGRELIQKAVEATGGAHAIDSLASYEAVGTVTDASGDRRIKTTFTILFPDHLRLERDIPNYGSIATIVVGNDAFEIRPTEVRVFSEAQRVNFRKTMTRNVLSSLQARNEPEYSAVYTGSEEINEKRVGKVAVDFGGQFLTLGIEATTGRVSTLAYLGRGPEGDYGQVVQTLSDHRTINGVTLPFRTSTTFNGQPVPQMSFTAESITLNGEVSTEVFERPTD